MIVSEIPKSKRSVAGHHPLTVASVQLRKSRILGIYAIRHKQTNPIPLTAFGWKRGTRSILLSRQTSSAVLPLSAALNIQMISSVLCRFCFVIRFYPFRLKPLTQSGSVSGGLIKFS